MYSSLMNDNLPYSSYGYDSMETKLCTKDHTEPKTSYIIRR
ncbi:hypothetical protein PROFUN_06603 [Planoprotostelium fungivorum]|uniref:Uncharacterized protein n=1 Tax=Planoprotostelium fungivorum TaxID=1890364 RepID=A0A2P6MS05_9EUKA|nr:hypothetical protein PROFUN_06603 [Planoprotostelium fungivorum]